MTIKVGSVSPSLAAISHRSYPLRVVGAVSSSVALSGFFVVLKLLCWNATLYFSLGEAVRFPHPHAISIAKLLCFVNIFAI